MSRPPRECWTHSPLRLPRTQAEMNSSCNLQRFEDRILCPICLEVLCNPVTTACGHNFCMACLQGYWDHQATQGEATCCPQCREPFSTRPCLRKNVILGEIVACLTPGQASAGHRQAGPGSCNIPCDACSPRKLRHLKPQHFYCRTDGCCLCQTCLLDDHKSHDTVSLEEERTHKEVQVRKAQASLENQMLIIVSESQTHQSRVAVVLKLIQAMREEVSNCFTEIGGEMERLQARVLQFVEAAAAKALGQLGRSIQDSHRRLVELESDSLWLQTLTHTPSDQQFLEEFAEMKPVPASSGLLLGAVCEESHSFPGLVEALAGLRVQLATVGLRFSNQALLTGVKMRTYEVLPAAMERKGLLKDYCNLNLDPTTAGEELFVFRETHTVLNLGILLEPSPAGARRDFNPWPQVLCTPSLADGRYYWEAEVSDSWVCLGVTYGGGAPSPGPAHCAGAIQGPAPAHRAGASQGPAPAHRAGAAPGPGPAPRRSIFYLIGRNSASWCLEWDSLKFSVWHDNTQTVLQGGYYRTIGVALDHAAGSLAFYGVAGGVSLLGGGVSLIYRFLTTFREPLFPAVMVSSGASVTLRHHPA